MTMDCNRRNEIFLDEDEGTGIRKVGDRQSRNSHPGKESPNSGTEDTDLVVTRTPPTTDRRKI